MTRLAPAVLGLLLIGMPHMAAAQSRVHATYEVYAAGLEVATVDAILAIGKTSYRMDIHYRTTGLIGFFLTGHQHNVVEGAWTDGQPQPRQFRGTGVWRGLNRTTLIDYDNGRPMIRELTPPAEQEREPVPLSIQQNSVDAMSAMAELMHRVGETGRCDDSVRLFDGRRASEVTATTRTDEVLAPTSRSVFSGPALRCDFVGRMVAGFRLDDDSDRRRRPLNGSAWLARPSPGSFPAPMRLAFETRWFGTATMYLTAIRVEPMATDQAATPVPVSAERRSRPSR